MRFPPWFLWAAAAAVVVPVYGPQLASLFRPSPGVYLDFVQEWLSARNFWAGDPVYLPQRESLLRRTGLDEPGFEREMMRWNAHPPVAVLAALPFGLIPDYRTAHLAWNLFTFPLFVLSVVVVVRELGLRPRPWWVLPFVVLTLASSPVLTQVGQGQLNFVLLPLLVAGWVADRRGYPAAAGVAVGLATAVKLFPGFVFVYFLFARRWRAVAAGAVTCLAANGMALALFGTEAFVTYARDVVPAVGVFGLSWRNVSLAGFWKRLFVPAGCPAVAAGVVLGSQLAVAAVVARLSQRAETVEDRDRAFAAAVVGMLLASPVAWPHYFLLLLVPAGVLFARLAPGPPRWAFLALLPVFWVRDTAFAGLALGKGGVELVTFQADPPPLLASLTGLAVFNYAVLALFALAACGRFSPDTRRPPDPDPG